MSKDNGIEKIDGNTIVVNDAEKFSKHLERRTAEIASPIKNIQYEVKKASLRDRVYAEVEVIEYVTIQHPGEKEQTVTNESKKTVRHLPHPDLIAAFDALKPHLPHLCEISDTNALLDPTDERLSCYEVTGFSIGGSDEHEGVTIIGRKNLSTGRVLNLCAPFTKWEDEHEPYRHSNRLHQAVVDAEHEVLLYVVHGKMAPPVQLELPLDKEVE